MQATWRLATGHIWLLGQDLGIPGLADLFPILGNCKHTPNVSGNTGIGKTFVESDY